LIEAIREVHIGGAPMSIHIARKVVASFRQVTAPLNGEETLSVREKEVLDHLVKGFLYKEIADALKISLDTVRTHVGHIYQKLHVRSRTEAVTKHLRQPGNIMPARRESNIA